MSLLGLFRFLVTICCCGLLSVSAFAQASSSFVVPVDGANTRFFGDQFVVRRPSLSINGYSCTATKTCNQGLGVQEILVLLNDPEVDPRTRLYGELVQEWARKELRMRPLDLAEVIDNTRILQARGLYALLLLVAEANGIEQDWVTTQPGGHPTAAVAVQAFLDAMAFLDVYGMDRDMSDDAVKWVSTVTNLARSLDLLLAVEIAAEFYDPKRFAAPLPALPTCLEKADILSFVAHETERLDELANIPVLFGIKRDEIQPGNWPMKVHVAVAYAALAQQLDIGNGCGSLPAYPYADWLNRGLRSAGSPTIQNRRKHWHYQTDSGRRFWAEGPYYFHLSLSEIIPFWHAVRINHLLDYHPDFSADDPFHASWFVDPLHWLADTVAPGGEILPLDDGNRAFMTKSDLLRWKASYGDTGVGRKFAWISDQRDSGLVIDANFLGVFLATPMQETGAGIQPVRALGTVEDLTGERTTEITAIVRQTGMDERGASVEHFLALNGEYEDAISRGEGHEQADQLQLLYYLDDASILMDSGYDDASGLNNSTWNHYYDHNVLTIHDGSDGGDGGLSAPTPDLFAFRIVSRHASAEYLGHVSRGRIDVLSGRVGLSLGGPLDSSVDAEYTRYVVLVGDPSSPYLIDVNRGSSLDSPVVFTMRYHVGGTFVGDPNGALLWKLTRSEGAPLEVRVHPYRLDGLMSVTITPDSGMERYRDNLAIDRLDLASVQSERSFGSVVFLEAGAKDHLVMAPGRIHTVPGSAAGQPDAWIFRRDAHTADIFVSTKPGTTTSTVTVDLDSDMLSLALEAGNEIGFVRLTNRSNGLWQEEDGFAYKLALTSTSVGRQSPEAHATGLLRIAPNPVRNHATITCIVEQPGQLRLSLFDVQGREVHVITDTYRQPGTYTHHLNTESLASGVYVLSQSGEHGRAIAPFVVQK